MCGLYYPLVWSIPLVELCRGYCGFGGASRTPVAEGGGALWKARRSISPREKSGEKTQCGQCATRSQRPWMRAAGRPVTRLRAVPRAIAPQMASKDRNEEYARLKAEFDTMQAEMDALGIGASSKKLEEFEVWRRRRAAKRNHPGAQRPRHRRRARNARRRWQPVRCCALWLPHCPTRTRARLGGSCLLAQL